MAIIIHQAICGERNKAWDLLKTTMPDSDIAKKIAFKTDLQDSSPSGIPWKPVIRGFPFDNYYLLVKTYPDTSPDVRKGRVFSHCLVIAKEDLHDIVDLKQLLAHFKDSIDKSISLERITRYEKTENIPTIRESLQPRFNKAIRGFTNIENHKSTIIWIGQEDYEDAVCRFWQLLAPEKRATFNFGINFNTSEIPTGKINFITTPENIENKFVNSGFYVIRKDDSIALTEFSEKFLASDIETSERLAAFKMAIETADFPVSEISIIAKGITTFENINTVKDLKLLITLSHIVAKYSPDEKKGIPFKNQLLDKICSITGKANVQEIMLLKIFKNESFKDSETKLSQAMIIWIDNILFSANENKKKDLTPIIKQYYEASSTNWWVNLIGEKVKNFLAKINSSRAEVIWQWITNNIGLLKELQSDIDFSITAENHFISHFPAKIEKSIFSALKSFAAKVKWLKLHATILKNEHPFELAISEQLKVDTDLQFDEAVKIITNGVKPQSILDFTVTSGDNRLIKITGHLCHEDSTLLSKINVRNSNWQGIWFEAISNGNNIADGIKNPQKEIFKLFDNIVDENSCNENLLEKISENEFANLLGYPKMELILLKLPISLKNKFLEKTASTLLKSVSEDSTFKVPSDKTLSDYIINSEAISTFLYYNQGNIKNALPIFNTFKQLPEHILKDYVSNYTGPLDVIDATQLGKLVSDRRYKSVANVIDNKTFSNNNFKYALTECYSMLGFFKQGLIFLSGRSSNVKITTDQWWDAIQELLIKLYSSGPSDNKIWLQAGGEEYDLLTSGTGKKLWIHALEKLRNGGCTGITIEKLLKKIRKEHPNNDELKTLKELKSKI